MKNGTAVVVYYNRPNKYSFNALVGAIEINERLKELKVYFIRKGEELFSGIEEVVERHKKVVVAISFSTPQLWDTYRIIQALRKKFDRNVMYITGGPHPTGDLEGTLRMGFDIAASGEGEETFVELLDKISTEEDYMQVEGIAFLDENGEYQYTGQRKSIADLDKYPPFAAEHKKFGPIEITRGCPFGCYFCQTARIFGGRPRHRSVDAICKYVQVMKDRGLKDIRVITPNAFSYGSENGRTLNVGKVKELLVNVAKIVKPEGRIFFGSFPSEVRPEHVTEETVDLVLKYADNDNLILGAQSGSARILESCHRGHTIEAIYRAVKLIRKSGLKANVDFIFGLPGETEKDVDLTIAAMDELTKMGARIHAHTFMPLPQTPYEYEPPGRLGKDFEKIVKRLVSKGIIYGDWREQARIAQRVAKYLRNRKLES